MYHGFHIYSGKIFIVFKFFLILFLPGTTESLLYLSICSVQHSRLTWKITLETVFESITAEQSISSRNNVSLLLRSRPQFLSICLKSFSIGCLIISRVLQSNKK